MMMHKDTFVTKWVVSITNRMVGMCEEGFAVPIIALFYNDAATADIITSKRDQRLMQAAFAKQAQQIAQLPWYSVSLRARHYLSLLRQRVAFRISIWRFQPSADAVRRCLECPEFEFLQYMHKLTQRMAAWRLFPQKQLRLNQLPAEFRVVKGPSDAPQEEYAHLCRIQEMADALIPVDMQRTMFAVMLSEKLTAGRSLTPAHRQ